MQSVKGLAKLPDYGARDGSVMIDLPYLEAGGLQTWDQSGNGYVPLLTGAEPEDWADSPLGGSVDLDGAAECTTVVTRAALQADGRRSYEIIVIPDQVDATYRCIFDHMNAGATAGLALLTNAGNLELYCNSGSAVFAVASQLAVGRMSHLFITLDGSTARLFRDGIAITSGAYTGSIATTVDLKFGNRSTFWFDGRIVLARVYNRRLTHEEVWERTIHPWQDYDPRDQGANLVASATNAALLVNGGLARSQMAGAGVLGRGW